MNIQDTLLIFLSILYAFKSNFEPIHPRKEEILAEFIEILPEFTYNA